MQNVCLILFLFAFSMSQREPVDPVGYATTPLQVQKTVEEAQREKNGPSKISGTLKESPLLTGICPHDDYIYAGPVYIPVLRQLQAEHIILIGVAHRAWKWNVKGVLIFDDFATWNGPLGNAPVDRELRDDLLRDLSEGEYVVSNEYHSEEHSLEALIPFIQHYSPDARILPVLVPSMHWERIEQLARSVAVSLGRVMKEKKWNWGEDVQILISSDFVHYGDQGWGGKNYAPFGCGTRGLEEARVRDIQYIQRYLEGPVSGKKLERLLYKLVKRDDVKEYRVTWCGRFCVPFGLALTEHLATRLGQTVPEGVLWRYDTSVELGELPLREAGLGTTAPSNLRHWVGYAAIGFY